MTTKLLIPILNSSVSTYRGPTWYLSDNVSIETITSEDYGVIHCSKNSDYQALVSPTSKCIKITNIDEKKSVNISKNESLKISFLLNYFKSRNPIALSFAVQISKVRKAKLDKIIDLQVISDTLFQRHKNYKIRKGIERNIISTFYQVLSKVLADYPGLFLTIDRYNSSLFRAEPHDKIIDITISLESLIRGKTELRHKFSLYNAWAADGDRKSRKNIYKMLMSLYDARSEIVHGTAMSQTEWSKKIKPILDRWDEIIIVSEKVLGYHILYVHDHGIEKWYEHQICLALGIQKRVDY